MCENVWWEHFFQNLHLLLFEEKLPLYYGNQLTATICGQLLLLNELEPRWLFNFPFSYLTSFFFQFLTRRLNLSHIKFRYCEKATKFEKNLLLTLFWYYLVMSEQSRVFSNWSLSFFIAIINKYERNQFKGSFWHETKIIN